MFQLDQLDGKYTVQTAHCAMVKELSLPNISPLLAISDGISCEKKTNKHFFVTQEKFPQNVISYPIDLYLY